MSETTPESNSTETNGTEATGPSFTLQQFPEKLAVVRLAPGAEVPTWAASSSLFSITATATETSLICATPSGPTKVTCQKTFTAFAEKGRAAVREEGGTDDGS